jgi:hypothetical protein
MERQGQEALAPGPQMNAITVTVFLLRLFDRELYLDSKFVKGR